MNARQRRKLKRFKARQLTIEQFNERFVRPFIEMFAEKMSDQLNKDIQRIYPTIKSTI